MDIKDIITQLEEQINRPVKKSDHVSFNPYEDISRIEAYINSKHISGDTDALGREKPFFNIVTAARNIWFRATDLDRKDIKIKATKSKDYLTSFFATLKLREFMNKKKFGAFLNDWGMTLATYNEAVIKVVEKEGDLHLSVTPWTRLLFDPIDFQNNPKIEILELTPAQLRKRPYDKKQVEALISATEARETIDGQQKDDKADYIKLYEVHGELPLSLLTGDEDDKDTYVQQMHVVSLVSTEKGKTEDYTLFKGKEGKDPYILTALMPEVDGSIGLNGSVKLLFDAQWMINHNIKLTKDQLDFASKQVFQTSDGNFVSQNALTSIETGDILIHKVNEPLTQVNNGSHDIGSLQAYAQQWKTIAQEITSTPDILMGQNMPSGTAYRQAAIIQQESHSNFEIMTENKGLYLEDLFREYILPYFKKQLANKDEVASMLESHEIAMIDTAFVKNKAIKRINNEAIEKALEGEEIEDLQGQLMNAENEIKGELSQLGNTRFFKPSELDNKDWKEAFKDLEWELEINITGESKNEQVVMETLTNVMSTIASNPAVLQDPTMRLVFNKIMELSNVISPLELSQVASQSISTAVPQGTPPQVSNQINQALNAT